MMDQNKPVFTNSSATIFSGQSTLSAYLGHEEKLVSLTEAFKDVLQRYSSLESKNAVILRMDALPCIEGTRDEIVQWCDHLLSMILNHPPLNSRLFLYIKCEEDKAAGNTDTSLGNGFKRYNLCIHTNISTCEDWRVLYREKLDECTLIARRHHASFLCNHISNTGCLFTLTLPGKLN